MIIVLMLVLVVVFATVLWFVVPGRARSPSADVRSFVLEHTIACVIGALIAGAIGLLIAWLRYG